MVLQFFEVLVKIRRALKADSKNIFDAQMRSIKEVCAKDYTPKQIAAWGGRRYDPDHWPKIIEKSYVWVIADRTNIFGLFSLLLPKANELAHITSLYIVPEALGNGFGKQFIKTAICGPVYLNWHSK